MTRKWPAVAGGIKSLDTLPEERHRGTRAHATSGRFRLTSGAGRADWPLRRAGARRRCHCIGHVEMIGRLIAQETRPRDDSGDDERRSEEAKESSRTGRESVDGAKSRSGRAVYHIIGVR